MKILKCAAALLLSVVLLTVPAFAISLTPGTGPDFYVQDTANVLSTETETAIVNYNATLESACDGAQLVVVTVNYLDGDSDVAATKLMNDWGVGSAQQSNGMLLLLVAGEYRGWLAVGDGLDNVFDDDMADMYLDSYFWDYIDEDRFDKGVQTLTGELYDWYLDYYNVGSNATSNSPAHINTSANPDTALATGAIVALIVAIILLILLLRAINTISMYNRMRRWGYTGGYWPVFWIGGRRRYRSWYQRRPMAPPPPPGPGPHSYYRPTSSYRPSRPSRPSGSGFGGHSSRPSGGGRPSGGFHSGGSFRGGGFGGHSGGGGGGRR